MSRILLVSPAFHGYWRAIAAALEARGHEVETLRYDAFDSPAAKLVNKLRYELPDRLGMGAGTGIVQAGLGVPALRAALTARAVQAVRDGSPEVVVVVKGDLLGPEFWGMLADRRLPRVLWLYDELRRTAFGSPDEVVAALAGGPVASYSPADTAALRAAGIEAHWLPLAYDHRNDPPPGPARVAEIVFVGARYAGREQVLAELVQAGLPVRAFGRQWSAHPWDRARTWRIDAPAVPAGRDVDRPAAYRTMQRAAATLNLHGDQDGLTMRTFEACGVGAVQLVDRPTDGLFDEGVELARFDSPAELVELCRRALREPAWADRLRAAGRARALAEHTFDHRVAVLERLWRRSTDW
ncbi:MAG TPA: glycosyltransferase [Dermatophilaceae bacterium]|nr:glycosyltransferase [Dermatophilaceae bacterium]